MRLIFLGTGTSFGVPQIGCRCATCTSVDPRDRRTRTAALIETEGKRLLIDTPPELRLQLVAAGVDHIDVVLFTHPHADHVHGIDDLRALSVRQGAMLPAYGSRGTMAELATKFPYIFDPSIVVPVGTSKPELEAHVLESGKTVFIAGVPVLPLSLPHGDHAVLGYSPPWRDSTCWCSTRCCRVPIRSTCPCRKRSPRHSASVPGARSSRISRTRTRTRLLPRSCLPASSLRMTGW